MRSEPNWIPFEEVVAVNRRAVEVSEEPFAVIDAGKLDGALGRPVNHWWYGEDDIVRLAATLLFGIADSHAFLQGNKRTGFTAAVMFLNANGYDLAARDTATLAHMVLRVLDPDLPDTREEFEVDIRPFVVPLPEHVIEH